MGTVMGITPGASGIAMQAPVALDRASGSSSGGAASGITGMGGSNAMEQLQGVLTQLLQEGGASNLQNNQMLQLLIGLMILLALLGNAQGSAATADQIYEQLGAGQGTQGQFAGVYTSSSTTITIEQSSSVMAFGGADAGGSQGGHFDTIA